MLPSSSRYRLVPPELPVLLLPVPDVEADDDDGATAAAPDDDALLLAEGDTVDDVLALLSRDVLRPAWARGFPMLAPAPVPKENICGPRSTSRLEEDGPPSSIEDDEEWLVAPGNASE